jgi:two-component system, OmpR family, phosphate regulon sensor histidine kinase PhoR
MKKIHSNIGNGFILTVVLALIITSVFLFLQYLSQAGILNKMYETMMLFFASFIILFVCIEWFVQREQHKIEELQKEEIDNLKKMESYRREFLAEVSHELRTPIFAVQGYIHTLMDGAMDDERVREKFLLKAIKNTDRLSSLVNDLLVITQMEAGEIEMRMRRFSLYHLSTEVVENLEGKMVKKDRNITCQIAPNGNQKTMVLADRERIHQVLTNLIDNAIKYGNQQGTISVILEREDDKLFISVKDNGAGIEESHLNKIFHRFYRVDKSRSRETGGTGLGLAICKHFIEAHGEVLTVESKIGEGTIFRFSLKIAVES